MSEPNDFYTPEHVDEQVDALFQERGTSARDQRLASDLHTLLECKDEDTFSLQRVWQRLVERDTLAQHGKIIPLADLRAQTQKQGRFVAISDTLPQAAKSPQRKPMFRVLSTLVAVLVVALVVGSLILVLNASHQTHTGEQGAQTPTVQASSPTQGPAGTQGQIVFTSNALSYYTAVVWSPDGSRVAYDADHSTLQTSDALTGQHVITYHTCTDADCYTTAIAWSPDGTTLAAAEGTRIYLFDAKTARLLHIFSAPSIAFNEGSTSPLAFISVLPVNRRAGGAPAFSSITWSPDSKSLAAAFDGDAHDIFVWNLANGSLSKTLSDLSTNSIPSVNWSPNGSMLSAVLLAASPEVSVWNTTTWQVVQRFSNTTASNWSPDGKRLALVETGPSQSFGDGKDVRIVDTQTWQTLSTFAGPQGKTIQNAHWSPDGSRLALETEDIISASAALQGTTTARISIWSVASGKQLFSFSDDQNVYQAAWSPDGKYIASFQVSGAIIPVPSVLIWIA